MENQYNHLVNSDESVESVELNRRQLVFKLGRSWERLLKQNKPIPLLFSEMTGKLSQFLSIERATLSINLPNQDELHIVAWWDLAGLKEGLAMPVDPKNSLLVKSLNKQSVHLYQIGDVNLDNFIESKLLMNESSCSLAICPIKHEDIVRAVVSFASPALHSFEFLELGHFDSVFSSLGAAIAQNESIINQLSSSVA